MNEPTHPPATGYLTLAEVALHFGGASKSWIEQNIRTGAIPSPVKIAGRRLWNRASLAAYDAAFIEKQDQLSKAAAAAAAATIDPVLA